MSRQIQIRRGDVAANDNFIGAIGEVTMDTTNNTLRVHDGQTLGGTTLAKQSEIPDLSPFDYVVAWQMPTAENNYTWYRKYKSGWVEQGGHVSGNSNGERVIYLPLTMANKNYQFIATFCLSGYDGSAEAVLSIRRQRNSTNDTTSKVAVITTYAIKGVNGYTGWEFDWFVQGIAA